ncbi:MAG TPA: FG-GAP repeat protein [Armatimonadota bacterium]|nr:FG-GAP repeat protein [Armatimonadota bacterium]
MNRILIGLVAVTTTCPSFAANLTVAKVKLVPSQGGEYEHFGTSVSMDGDYAILGAPAPLPSQGGWLRLCLQA